MRSSYGPRKSEPARLALGVLAALTLLASDAGPSADSVLEGVQSRYDGIRDLQARFVQKSLTAALGTEEVLRGSMAVQRPGRMRWSYDAPDGRVIVLDGDAIRMYVPEDEQLQIAPLAPDTVSPTALSFLMGEGRLVDQFSAKLVDAPEGTLGLRLLPSGDPNFESLVLWVDALTYDLRASELVDLFGNRTHLSLEDARVNADLEPGTFEVEVPPGTEVIDLRNSGAARGSEPR